MTTVIESGRVVPYRVGLCAASICAAGDAAPDEIEREVNAQHPTGISSRWEISDEDFATGEKNGSPCHDDPSRKHWLLEC